MDRKEYQKQYRLKNKDRLRASNKEYYLTNKDKINKRGKEYREKNKDRKRERDKVYGKQYRAKNKEKIKARMEPYMKEYREKNKDVIKVQRKEYRNANKDKLREKIKEWKLKNEQYIKIWQQSHQLIFLGKHITVDNIEKTFHCICCRFQGSTSLHHMKYDLNDPLKYTVELCRRCHTMWHVEESYLRFGKKKLLPAKELIVENTMELEEGIGGDGL